MVLCCTFEIDENWLHDIATDCAVLATDHEALVSMIEDTDDERLSDVLADCADVSYQIGNQSLLSGHTVVHETVAVG